MLIFGCFLLQFFAVEIVNKIGGFGMFGNVPYSRSVRPHYGEVMRVCKVRRGVLASATCVHYRRDAHLLLQPSGFNSFRVSRLQHTKAENVRKNCACIMGRGFTLAFWCVRVYVCIYI